MSLVRAFPPIAVSILLSAVGLLPFTYAAGLDGGSAGGGGQSIKIEGRPALRDLVDQTVCQWVTAAQFQKREAPGFAQILSELQGVHWYLADAYSREVGKIRFCLTQGALKFIPAEDRDGLTIFEQESSQAAIRLNDTVYVNMSIVSAMSPTDRTFLFAHELTHSFLPMEAPRRNESLRSFIRMLAGGFDRDALGLAIEANHLALAPTTETLDPYRTKVLKLVKESTPLMDRIELSQKLTLIKNELTPADRYLFEDGLREKWNNLVIRIKAAIESDDGEAVIGLFTSENLKMNMVIYKWEKRDSRPGIDFGYPRYDAFYYAYQTGKHDVLKHLLQKPDFEITPVSLARFIYEQMRGGRNEIPFSDCMETVRVLTERLVENKTTTWGSLTHPLVPKDYSKRDQLVQLVCSIAKLTPSQCAHQVRGQLW